MSAAQLVSLAQRLGQESHKLPAGNSRDSGPLRAAAKETTVQQTLQL